MHVRLAFAVAAHLEPEILVIDEVLAAADAPAEREPRRLRGLNICGTDRQAAAG